MCCNPAIRVAVVVHHPVNVIDTGMKPVEGHFIHHPQKNQNPRHQSYGKAKDLDDGVSLVTD
ncbi:hypothetical protein D9M68_850200 [compost metagenome]